MSLARRFAPFILLAALALAYFAAMLAHPSHTLYADHSDLIALHVPWEVFLARAWRLDGERPLWNPLQFAGLPFAHDVQAAISYPPHVLFRLVGERGVGPALSWLIVAHVVVAGWGMYAYARATGLETTAALVAAIGFMFAGKWLLHLLLAGHYAFVGLAWLPWCLLGLDRAIAARSLLAATWGGVSFGMLALSTHPQLTLYSGLFLAAWTFSSVLDAGDGNPLLRLVRWAGFGCWLAIVGIALAAAQLLPGLESAEAATRGLTGMPERATISIHALLRALGPSPKGVRPVLSWEARSGLGAVWLAVAAVAPLLTHGRDRRRAWAALVIGLGLTAYGLGGAGVFQGLPGFRLFRQPSRIFLVASLPVAYLAGLTTQALLDRPGPSPKTRARASRIVAKLSLGLVAWLAASALIDGVKGLRPHPYWFSLIVTMLMARRLVGTDPARIGRGWRAAWFGVLLVDLVVQTWPYVQTRDLDDILAPSASARYVADHAGPLDRVLDRNLPDHQSSTPMGPAVATQLGLHQVRGYNALDIVRAKDYLAMVADPIPIRNPYNGLINAPILHKPLLDLLGVRFLVQPVDPALRSVTAEPDPDLDPRWRKAASDPAPSAFTFAAGGLRTLPPYEVLENTEAFPRAFVVPTLKPMPVDRAGIVRAMTSTDFRRTALVESPGLLDVGPGTAPFRPATVVSHRPNRIAIDADGPGLLVLTDPWYPGWLATVDGSPGPILRADYLFRGIVLAPGRHAIAFEFRPESYKTGQRLGLLAILTVSLITAGSLIRHWALHARRNMVPYVFASEKPG